MFVNTEFKEKLLSDHSHIQPNKHYSNEEKYELCFSLLSHMKEEEEVVWSIHEASEASSQYPLTHHTKTD